MKSRVFRLLQFCKRPAFLLAVCWIIGMFFGAFISLHAGDSYLLMTRAAPSCRVSVLGLVTAVYLPFLICVFAVRLSKPYVLYPVCFLKAFSFALCGCVLYGSFGSAGWLIRLLLQFSDCLFLTVFCWFCLRHVSGARRLLKRDTAIATGLFLAIGAFDLCVVSPFLAKLIEI